MGFSILDQGPIAHADLVRFDDSDIELALEQSRFASQPVSYRLIEVDLADIEDTNWLPDTPRADLTEALNRGESLPPIIVFRPGHRSPFGLLDGVNRTQTHRLLGFSAIRAYEVLVAPQASTPQ